MGTSDAIVSACHMLVEVLYLAEYGYITLVTWAFHSKAILLAVRFVEFIDRNRFRRELQYLPLR